jgi:hypothetical protein
VALAETKVYAGGDLTGSTGSFTPPANSILTFHVFWFGTVNHTTTGLSVSGGSLTWTRQSGIIRPDNGGMAPSFFPLHEVWTAPVGGSPSSMTISLGSPTGEIFYDAHVIAYTGYDTGTPIGATGTGTNPGQGNHTSFSITLGAAPASTSFVVASLAVGANNAAGPVTPGAGWTELYDWVSADTGGLGFQSESRTSSTSTSVDWADIDTNGGLGTAWGLSGFGMEIVAAGGADVLMSQILL